MQPKPEEHQQALGLQTAALNSCSGSWRSTGAFPKAASRAAGPCRLCLSPQPTSGRAVCPQQGQHPGTTHCWGPQPAQLLLQRFRKEMKARIMRFLSTRHFCSDTFLRPWAEDPNKMIVLFLSSRIILVASELLGASISQQKIEMLCLSGNISTSLLKNNGSFIL